MTAYQNRSTRDLSPEHSRTLEEGSAIGGPEIAASGARTIRRASELSREFSSRQRRRAPGILFVTHRPNGESSYIFRPDAVDPEKPGHKYELPCKSRGAPGNTLDIPPSLHDLIEDISVPVIFVEGTKKMLSVATAARREGVTVLVIAISGCWNWMAEGKPITDMFDIPVDGRSVTVTFDSDMLHKIEVQEAARALAEHLQDRGARVFITYFRDAPDGSKVGADDFFVAGGTFAALRKLTRPYDPEDFAKVRLRRNEGLRAMLEDLAARFWAHDYKGMGGHSMRDVFAVAIEEAAASATVHGQGLRLQLATRTWARRAKVSSRTLQKALDRLEDAGLGYRDNEGRKPDKPGAFVLRANVNQYGTEQGTEQNATQGLQSLYARGLHLRAPRLRWSSPGSERKRGTVKGTRRVRESVRQERPAIKRLGKIRGAALDTLDEAGGSMPLVKLCEALHRSRPRDFRRRTLALLEEAGIIAIGGDVVSLTDDWLERLEEQRKLGREREADKRERARHRKESNDYRAGLEAIRRSHRRRAKEMHKDAGSVEELKRVRDPDPELMDVLRDVLRRYPDHRDDYPNWFRLTLWADRYTTGKPDLAAVEVALDELRREGVAA